MKPTKQDKWIDSIYEAIIEGKLTVFTMKGQKTYAVCDFNRMKNGGIELIIEPVIGKSKKERK